MSINDRWRGWRRIGDLPPSKGWFWKATKGGNLNHYRHESNGKSIVSTWGELTNAELLILDSNRNGPELLKEMHLPQKRRAKPKQRYAGDDSAPAVHTRKNIDLISKQMAEQQERDLKEATRRFEEAKRTAAAQRNNIFVDRNKFLENIKKKEKNAARIAKKSRKVLDLKINSIRKKYKNFQKEMELKLASLDKHKKAVEEEMQKCLSQIQSEIAEENARPLEITSLELKKQDVPGNQPSFSISNTSVFACILADRINSEVMHGLITVTNALNSLNQKNLRKKIITMKLASRCNDIMHIFNKFLPMGTYEVSQLPDAIDKPVIILKNGVRVVSRARAEVKCEPGTEIISIDDDKPFIISYKATKGGDKPRSNILVTLEFYRKCQAPNCSLTGWYDC